MRSGSHFAFAGLWETWKDKVTGPELQTCTNLTTDPRELMEQIHDRIPVIVLPKDYARWERWTAATDPAHPPVDLLRPFPAEQMKAWRVGRAVGNTRNNDPSLIVPILTRHPEATALPVDAPAFELRAETFPLVRPIFDDRLTEELRGGKFKMSSGEHWDSIYQSKGDERLSWTQAEPLISLKLIGEACSSGQVFDVGGGSSPLAERLLDRGYSVSILDISKSALGRTPNRLGDEASQIRWIVADISTGPSLGSCDVWHDRAVFHFLTAPVDRAGYKSSLLQTVPVGGHVIIGTFALNGPERCSGLPVRRYDGWMVAEELGIHFELLKSESEIHITPWGESQSFQFSLFMRV